MTFLKNQKIILVILAGLVAISFNACTSKHTELAPSVGGLKTSGTPQSCADAPSDEMGLFAGSFHPWVQNKCVSCHAGGGPGPGAFANSGLQIAWDSFGGLGYSKVASRAIDGHSAQSGSMNNAPITELTEIYINGLQTIEACKNAGNNGGPAEIQDSEDRFKTLSKAINPNPNGPVRVSWSLKSDLITHTGINPAAFDDATIEVDVQIYQRPGITSYVVSRPRIHTSNLDIHLQSVLIKINNKAAAAQRAFFYIDANIRAWNAAHPDFGNAAARISNDLVSDGSIVATGDIRTTDVISLSLGKLEVVKLPPPEQGPEVKFSIAAQSANESAGIVNINVELSKPWTEQTSLEIDYAGETTIRDHCCSNTRNNDGQNIEIQNFDRDLEVNGGFRVQNSLGATLGRLLVTFRAGETSKQIPIRIIEDRRFEVSEILHLRIGALTKLKKAATNQEYRLTITDNDAAPSGIARTYSQLMGTGGILNQYCIRCHNSVDNRGGYDMTNHEQMVTKGILIPGNVDSKMFMRMNTKLQDFDTMPPAAAGGLIQTYERIDVENWIKAGAPND